MGKKIFITVGFVLGFALILAQDTSRVSKFKYGVIFGEGIQNMRQLTGEFLADELNRCGIYPGDVNIWVNYYYQVYFLQFQFFYTFMQKENFSMDLLVQPQTNFTLYRTRDTVTNYYNGFECGLNVGVVMRKTLSDLLSVYLIISSGPHYVSGVPERQSPGFLFSDNIFAGAKVKLGDDLYFDLRPGFRHISNANLQKPNGGVNTLVFNFGLEF